MTARHGTRSRHWAAALAAVLAVAGAGCASDGGGSHALSGFVADPPLSVAGLSLPEASNGGAAFVLTPAQGRLLIVYFGYTACPDVCPTTMHEVEVALREVGDLASRVEVAMITVDPGRDEPQLLTGYLRGFVADGHALRTTDDTALGAVAGAFGASYSVNTSAEGVVTVSHTPNLYLVDDTASIVLTWPFGLPGDAIADDLRTLLETA